MKHYSSTIRFVTVTLCAWLLLPVLCYADTSVNLTRASGGGGGSPFVDMAAGRGEIVAITVRSGNLIDSVMLTYRYGNKRVNGPRHGGNGGNQKTFKLKNGERIIELGGKSGKYVDSLYIRTSMNRTQRWGGPGGSTSYKFNASKKYPIMGLWGRSGALLDAIGAVKAGGCGQAIQTQSLTSYSQAENSAGFNDEKADTVQVRTFPAPADSRNMLDRWLSSQNDKLLKIVKQLAGSTAEYNKYLSGERENCQSQLYCELAYRRGAISHVTGAQ